MPRTFGPRLLRKGFTLAAMLCAIAAVLYCGMLAFLYLSQERLLFRATVLPGDHRFEFSQPFEEIRIPVPGAVLDALYFPQQESRGLSLGSGLAASLARDVHPALLVLVSPYTSIAAAAKRSYPLAPEWLLKYPLRTDAIIGEVRSPLVLLHGSDDALIPSSESERLRSLARSPVELVLIDGAGHNDIHRFPAYLDALAARLRSLTGDR